MSFWKRFVAHNSEIIRPILTLGVGSVCAQLIPFVMSFVLARLYSPEAFGELGLFVNYAGILLIIASARYELAIVRARTPSEAASISFLSAGIAFLLCLFLTILISITDLCRWEYIRGVSGRYLLPAFVFFSALFQILVNYQNYTEGYKSIAYFTVFRNIIQAIARVSFSFLSYMNGLIWGALTGVIGGCLLFFVRKLTFPWHLVSPRKIGYVLRRYVNFPKYALPSSLFNSLSTNLPVILFALFFSKQEVGYFTMTTTLFYLPVSLVSNSIGQVFYKKASVWDSGKTAHFCWLILCFNGLLSGLVLAFLLGMGSPLFAYLLGEEWQTIGDYAILLLPWFILVLCFSPLSLIFDVKDRQRTEMYLNIAAFTTRVAAILVGGYGALSAQDVILGYGLCGVVVWLIEGLIIFRIVKVPALRQWAFIVYLSGLVIIWGIYVWYRFV